MHKNNPTAKVAVLNRMKWKWKRSRRGRERFHRRKRIPNRFAKDGRNGDENERGSRTYRRQTWIQHWTLNASSNVISFDSARPFIQTKNGTLCKSSFRFDTQTTSNPTWNGLSIEANFLKCNEIECKYKKGWKRVHERRDGWKRNPFRGFRAHTTCHPFPRACSVKL